MAGKNYKKMKNHEDKNIPNGWGITQMKMLQMVDK